jgi:hypothetical protein
MGGEAKLARCPRCHQPTLVAERQGYRIAIDILPADALGFGVAVAGGIDLYWAQNEPGQPSRVLGPRSAATNPSWAPGGSQTGSQRLHAEHSCGASARDQVILNVSGPKSSAPATPGAPKAGSRPRTALAGATAGLGHPYPAGPVTSHLSSRPARCSTCNRVVKPGEVASEIRWGAYVWANHEECP